MNKGVGRKAVVEYTVVFQEEKIGGFSVWVPDLPGCASQGDTFEEALRNIKEAIELYIEDSPSIQSAEGYKRQFIMPVTLNNA